MAIVNRIFTVLGKPADAKDEQVNEQTLQGGGGGVRVLGQF